MTRLRPPTWITTAAGWVGGKALSPARRLIDAWDAADTELASAGADLGWQPDEEDSP